MIHEEAGVISELLEAIHTDPSGGAARECWSALARVVDEEPTYVFHDGDENGMNVRCMVLTGPFVGAEVVAMVSCPLGGGFETRPMSKGQRVLLHFLEGRVDGHIVAVASVPGGAENPIPKSIAGVPLTSEGVTDQGQAEANRADQPRAWMRAPPKGVGLRDYLRGAISVTRLKGMLASFFSGWVVAGDDGATIQMSWNDFLKAYAIQLKDALGAQLSIGGGVVALISPDGKTRIEVRNGAILAISDGKTEVLGSPLNLNFSLADGIPTPATGGAVVAKAGGPIVGAVAVSKNTFIGGTSLWDSHKKSTRHAAKS
jgi:hypothetical protein